MLRLFQGNFIFGEATFLHFFRVTTSAQQLHLRSSYFFRAAAFFSFFRTVTFLQQLFFQNSFFFRVKILQHSQVLYDRFKKFFKKFFMTVTFRNSYFVPVQDKNILKRATFSKLVILHSFNFFRKAAFWKKLVFQESNILHCLLFLESFLFRAATFLEDSTFYSTYLFRRPTFNIAFQKSYYFKTMLFFPQWHLSVIRQ